MPFKPKKGFIYTSGRNRSSGQPGEGSYSVNTKITEPGQVPYTYKGDPETQVGKYVTSKDQISTQPVQDTRGFFGTIFSPNTAKDLNNQLALQRLVRQELLPSILEEEKGKQGIITQALGERLQQQYEQKKGQGLVPQPSLTAEESQVPYNLPVEPTEYIKAIQESGQPYLPTNEAGITENQRILNERGTLASQSELTKARAVETELERARLAFEQKKLTMPSYKELGTSLIKISPEGQESYVGSGVPGHFTEPVFTKDPKTGKMMMTSMGGQYAKPTFEFTRKPVGNVYAPSGAQNNLATPPEVAPGAPMSRQTNQFLSHDENGNPIIQHSQGEPPLTPPVVPTNYLRPGEAYSNFSIYSSPEMKTMAEEEYKKRLTKKLQNRAWNPIDWQNILQ